MKTIFPDFFFPEDYFHRNYGKKKKQTFDHILAGWGWVGGREHLLIFLNILEYQTQKELFL